MKKLTLDLDGLRVESFETAASDGTRGTVHARSTEGRPCEGSGYSGNCTWSCNGTCVQTCASCADTSCTCESGVELYTPCCGSQYASLCGGLPCH